LRLANVSFVHFIGDYWSLVTFMLSCRQALLQTLLPNMCDLSISRSSNRYTCKLYGVFHARCGH